MILVCNQCHSFGTFIQEIVVNKFAEISLPCAIAEAVLNLNDSVENYSGSYLPGLRYCSTIVSLGTALFWPTIKIEKPKGFIKDTYLRSAKSAQADRDESQVTCAQTVGF